MNSVNLWKQLKHLFVFFNREDAKFYIVYDTGITSLGPEKQFKNLTEALINYLPIATERLLTNLGYFAKTDVPDILDQQLKLVNKILIDHKDFAVIDGKYFLARECSTLKILVGIKENFLNDIFLNSYGLKETEQVKNNKTQIINNGMNDKSQIIDNEPLFNGLSDIFDSTSETTQLKEVESKCSPDQVLTNRKRIFDQSIFSSEILINTIKNIKEISGVQKEDFEKKRDILIKESYDKKLKELTEPNEATSIEDAIGVAFDKNNPEQFELAKEKARNFAVESNPRTNILPFPIVDIPSSDLKQLLLNKDDPRYKTMFDLDSLGSNITATIDWKIVFIDLLKCAGKNLDQTQLVKLLSVFGDFKKNIEEFIKWWYTDEICAPLLLNKIFDAFAFLSIPYLPTYNPRGNAPNIIEDFIKKLLTELLSMFLRMMLQGTADCSLNALNSDPNRPAAKAFANAADDLFGAPEFDDFLKNDIGTTKENKIADLKNQLTDFTKNAIAILNDNELCNLLQGKSLTSEGYEVLESLLNRKYPDLAIYINNRTKISVLFSKLDDIAKEIGLDLSLCQDLQNLNNDVLHDKRPIYDIICKTKEIDDLRKELLANKGLTPKEITDELDNINKDANKNLEDFVKAMNGDVSGLNNIPFFCRDRDITNSKQAPKSLLGNNDVIKDTLKTTANSTFNKIYDSFDEEIKKWDTFYKFDSAQVGNGRLVVSDKGAITFEAGEKVLSTESGIKSTLKVATILQNSYLNTYQSQQKLGVTPPLNIEIDHRELKTFDNFHDENLKEIILTSNAAKFSKSFNIYRNAAFAAIGSIIGEKINFIITEDIRVGPLDLESIGFKLVDVQPELKEFFNYTGFHDNFTSYEQKPADNFIAIVKSTERVIFNGASKILGTLNGLDVLFKDMENSWNEYKKAIGDSDSVTEFFLKQKIESLYPYYNLKYDNKNLLITKNDNNFIGISNISSSLSTTRAFDLQNIINLASPRIADKFKVSELDIEKAEKFIIASLGSKINAASKNYFTINQIAGGADEDIGDSEVNPSKAKTDIALLSALNLYISPDNCGRPNLLNLDNIKNRVIDIMQNDSCFPAPITDQNQPKNNLNDYDGAMLSGIVLTFIRLNVLECILKGIFPFSYFKIDDLKTDLILEFILAFTEKEIKRFGTSFELKFMDIMKSLYNKQKLVTLDKIDDAFELTNRQILKLFIKNELNFHLDGDKNPRFRTLYNKFLTRQSIVSKSVLDENYLIYMNGQKEIKYFDSKLFFFENGISLIPLGMQIDIKYKDIILKNIYSIQNYLSLAAITSIMSSWSSRPQFNIFLQTKIQLKTSFQIITNNLNRNYGLETPSLEELLNSGAANSFIVGAILRTPLNIFKAFCEGGDANISIASKIFLAGKIIEPDLPLAVLPLTSFGLMYFIWPTPLTIAYDVIVGIEAIAELAESIDRKEKETKQIQDFAKGTPEAC